MLFGSACLVTLSSLARFGGGIDTLLERDIRMGLGKIGRDGSPRSISDEKMFEINAPSPEYIITNYHCPRSDRDGLMVAIQPRMSIKICCIVPTRGNMKRQKPTGEFRMCKTELRGLCSRRISWRPLLLVISISHPLIQVLPRCSRLFQNSSSFPAL